MQPVQSKKTLIIIVAVVLSCAVLVLAFALTKATSKYSINVIASPADSKITLDGKPIKAGKVLMDRGKHTLKATRQYFGDATKTFDTRTTIDGQTIYLLPEPNTDQAKQYMSSHPEDQVIRERALGNEFSQTQEHILDAYPIVSSLPYETLDYKIDYLVDEAKKVSLVITLKPIATPDQPNQYKQELTDYKNEALTYLQSKGVDETKMTITFTPDPDT